MIKNYKDLTDKEKSILRNNKVVVSEMIDGLRFKVAFSDSGYVLKTAKGKVIDEIDCIVNPFYNELVEHMSGIITKNRLVDVIKHFGNCEAQFIYIPQNTYNVISYDNYTKKRLVYCSLFTQNKDLLDTVNFFHIFENDVENMPVIAVHDGINESFSVAELCRNKTFTGNSVEDIEAIILESGKVRCKIVVNDTRVNIDPTTKKIYRDIIIEDFAKVMKDVDVDSIFNEDDSYVDCICNMFYEYINKTDIRNKVYIETEDLLPPSMNNAGDMNLENLPSTAKLICSNKFNMNVLRLLLVTFNTENYHKFNTFPEPVTVVLNKILKKINGE